MFLAMLLVGLPPTPAGPAKGTNNMFRTNT